MITLYGIELSFPVNRVRLCLNALNLDYEFKRLSPLAGETQTPEFLSISPSGKIPGIEVDDFKLFESNAIMKYLARKYDSEFYPSDIEAQANVDKWLDFSTIHVGNGMAKILFNKVLAPTLGMDIDEQSMKDGYGFVNRFLGVVDDHLTNSNYLASESLSIADFCLLATVDPLEVVEVDVNEFPNLKAWREKLMAETFYTKMHNSYADVLEAMKAGMK